MKKPRTPYRRFLSFPIVCLITIAAGTVFSQTGEKKPTPTPERSREIVSLLNDARLAAPELGVDTFLKVVESKKVTDPVWRKEITDEALRMTEDVKNPVGFWPVQIRGINMMNTEAALILSDHMQKLDRLSLKSRIIVLLADTDRERAKQMVFEMGSQLGLKRRTCNDYLTYYVGDIYASVGKVAKAGFTEKQVTEGQRALFIAPWLENIDSPEQIVPALDLLNQMQGSPAERQILFSALSKAINRNFNDDRAFTHAVGWGDTGAKVAKLVAGENDPQKTDLNLAYREFLLKNLHGTRCKDNEIIKNEPLPKYIESANELMPQKPLAFEDVTTSDFSETGKFVDILARSASVQKLFQELRALKGKIVDNKIVNDSGPDWESRVTDFVAKELDWAGTDGETESETLLVKSAGFGAMLESIDDGELKKSVVRQYLRMLAGSRLQKTSFIEWLTLVAQLQKTNTALFLEIAPEFPNPNLKVMVATKKLGL